jgi:hypothetical protein
MVGIAFGVGVGFGSSVFLHCSKMSTTVTIKINTGDKCAGLVFMSDYLGGVLINNRYNL